MAALVFVVIKMFDTFARIFWLSVILLELRHTEREKKNIFPWVRVTLWQSIASGASTEKFLMKN